MIFMNYTCAWDENTDCMIETDTIIVECDLCILSKLFIFVESYYLCAQGWNLSVHSFSEHSKENEYSW